MAKSERYQLDKDRQGVTWDLLMYIPTVAGLAIGASIFWYQPNHALAYLVYFLACFFFYQGIHRVLAKVLRTAEVRRSIGFGRNILVPVMTIPIAKQLP